MTDKKMVSVVIPALNEAEGIGECLESIPREELGKMGYDVEIVVVDGESTDGTRGIAESHGARVLIEPRKGYGRAYKTGFAEARGDVIVTGDADTTYPFGRMDELVALLDREGLDFISTNRFADPDPGAFSLKHRVGNWVLSTTSKLLFLVPFKDSQSGMWVFRRTILDDVELTADGMPYSEEIKIEAFRHPEVVAREVPIPFHARVGDVKLSSWRDGFRNLLFLFRKRFGLHRDGSEES